MENETYKKTYQAVVYILKILWFLAIPCALFCVFNKPIDNIWFYKYIGMLTIGTGLFFIFGLMIEEIELELAPLYILFILAIPIILMYSLVMLFVVLIILGLIYIFRNELGLDLPPEEGRIDNSIGFAEEVNGIIDRTFTFKRICKIIFWGAAVLGLIFLINSYDNYYLFFIPFTSAIISKATAIFAANSKIKKASAAAYRFFVVIFLLIFTIICIMWMLSPV